MDNATYDTTETRRRDVLVRFAALLTPVAAVLIGIVYLVYRLEARAADSALQSSSQHAVELQGRIIEARLSNVISDLLILASHHELSLLLEAHGDDHLRALAQEFQAFNATKRSYDQVRFLDASGWETVRTNRTVSGAEIVPSNQLQDKSDRYYFTDTLPLEERQVFVSPFDLNVEGGQIEVPHKPMLRFATPVVGEHGDKRGIVVLNYLGVALLNDLTSGEEVGAMMLLNRDGYWLKAPRREDEWGFMLEERQDRRFSSDYPEAWDRIAAGETGQFRTANGLFTYATIHPAGHEMSLVGGVSAGGAWKVVCHIPRQEIEAMASRLARNLVVLAFLLLVVAAVGTWLVALNAARRKLFEEALRTARDAAVEANRAKSDFLANMSHEIRTPLNGIAGMTELLLTTEVTDVQRSYLEAVDTSAEALMAIISDLLDLAKIEAGKMELEVAPFRLSESVDSVLEIMAMRANAKGLELTAEIDGDVPDVLVGDSVRLRQIIINLAGNAVKFTEDGEVSVKVAVHDRGDDWVALLVAVRDTGIGIAAEHQEAIFESFSQADSSTTRRFGGTGLGLTISSQLVTMMAGRIWVESKAGMGSTFAFTARLGVGSAPLPSPQPALPSAIVGVRVLVVDDNQTNRRILEDTLRSWDMAPTVAENGPEALDLARQAVAAGAAYEIVLMDHMMPAMDGLQVARSMHQEASLRDATVMLLSSGDTHLDAAALNEAGIHSQLRKPITQAKLRAAILASRPGSGPSSEHQRDTAAGGTTAPLRVLLAEDNRINQAVAIGMLEKEGHTVTAVVNGCEVLAALDAAAYDLILMDLQMPEMGGLEATESIRSRETATGDHICIVGLTANAMKSDEDACLAAGMDAYIAKPFRRQKLVEVLASLDVGAGSVGTPVTDDRDLPVVDAETVAELKALEEEGSFSVREVIEIFDDEADTRSAAIIAAVEAADGSGLQYEAHTLKGSARDLGARRLAAVCQELEDRGAAGEFQGTDGLTRRMAVELDAARTELRSLLS